MRALRINYVGELGWELHMPMAQLERVYDAVWAAGEALRHRRFRQLCCERLTLGESLCGWGVELTNEITMIEAGLERFVKYDKGDFVGREALLRRKEEGHTNQVGLY